MISFSFVNNLISSSRTVRTLMGQCRVRNSTTPKIWSPFGWGFSYQFQHFLPAGYCSRHSHHSTWRLQARRLKCISVCSQNSISNFHSENEFYPEGSSQWRSSCLILWRVYRSLELWISSYCETYFWWLPDSFIFP